ncbi:Stringent starvation protein A [Candidatus Annandia adelgestsuga]|uniref:Stringent starvation protein A n=1 Tax=Candidatus Annandia adelgestsuga TaxID=1302411 RepID=A0A3S9J7S3_9ENTR|nr:hypothetical protein [Candidatus Annandia adelgestsuga]AZP36299.1 Stringent starvation protein A [Candidatus Annandia adelgestsuga]
MIIKKNRYNQLKLFSKKNDIYSHKIRMVLSIKNLYIKINKILLNNLPKKIFNFYNYKKKKKIFFSKRLMLIDRYIILYESNIIINYINEKFPYPILISKNILKKSENNFITNNIKFNWYKLINIIDNNIKNYKEKSKNQLSKEFSKLSYFFIKKSSFLINLKLTLLDCYIAPILWKIKKLKININGKYKDEIYNYMYYVFSQEKFIKSLTKYEKKYYFKI